MPRTFLLYWKPATVVNNLESGGELEHAASEQLGKVRVGDTVWVAGVSDGWFHLLGRIIVGFVTDQDGAARRLKVDPDDLWGATYHIIAAAQTAQDIIPALAHGVAADLRFESQRDRLEMSEGRINPQQLQSLRELNEKSASLLAQHWASAYGE